MNRIALSVFWTVLASANLACGHGHPIRVEVANNRLIVSQGTPDTTGFADQIYVEQDSAGDPEDFDNFVGFGDAIYWTVPGLNIFGLAENSGLYLETLTRPVMDSSPVEQRVFWYWNPSTEEVEVAPASSQMQIRRSATVNILLTPTTLVAPPPIKIAAPLASDMGFHNHNLVRYLLPVPVPQEGAYAFFARLTSDLYAPSDPFLVVINNGVEYSQMLEAALAINAAANSIPGDFNGDGIVDAADFTVWRDGLGSKYTIDHYTEWKDNFGQMGGGNIASPPTTVPEPAGLVTTMLAAVGTCGLRKQRHRTHCRARNCRRRV
jgi:hypothetical protein